jgi:superfamily II DNA or RNA helicase
LSKSLGSLEFKFPWRSYQAKLLKNFKSHMEDNHFHVIAPPGSGKTILGIEIVKRIGKKTLVLAPTLTIRNQWKNRMESFFTENKRFDSSSFDLRNPNDITFSTYQSLHAFYKTFEDKSEYFDFFRKHQIETLVLDEAHHLKNEWWKCLMALKNNNPFFIVGLTATPPYDSNKTEVSKYFELCGGIDDEIAVPDLVRENDLCPHQDYVYFSKPKDEEINFIVEFRLKIADFKTNLLKDSAFISFIKNHRFYINPELHLEDIYTNTEYFSSILIFLNASGLEINYDKLKILGFKKKELINFPKLHLEWLQILFENLLITDRELLIEHEEYLKGFEKELRQLNVFEKRKVNFVGEELLYKSLANSPSKLESIETIVSFERKSLKESLRCVVLTDYIRKEFLNIEDDKIEEINKIGVVPIFQYLKYNYSNKNEIAILSGSLVIIHNTIKDAFGVLVNEKHYSFTPLKSDETFLILTSKKRTEKSLVNIITTLFENGYIKVLIGTKSLLGEGWDAPSINSLVLATFVGSFVSSNQMRGRAIRNDPNNKDKIGNIWHIACVDTSVKDGGRDINTIKRRFEAFVGVSNSEKPIIENGFERLGYPEYLLAEDINTLNKESLTKAKDRKSVKNKWRIAINKGTCLNKEVKLFPLGEQSFSKQKQVYYFDVIRFFVAELFISIMLFYTEFVLRNIQVVLQQGVVYFIYAFLTAFSLLFGVKLYKAITLYFRYGFLYKRIKKMGMAILKSLYELNYVTSSKDVFVESKLFGKGDVVCYLVGANQFENTLFSKALNELLEPIQTPRYLIIKTNFFRKQLNIENFYPVPEIFGDRKKHVLVFQKHWSIHMGANRLFYTRHIEGRKLLLKARLFHVYNAFNKASREVIAWR